MQTYFADRAFRVMQLPTHQWLDAPIHHIV